MEWQPTACILCECNCGIEIRVGESGGGLLLGESLGPS